MFAEIEIGYGAIFASGIAFAIPTIGFGLAYESIVDWASKSMRRFERLASYANASVFLSTLIFAYLLAASNVLQLVQSKPISLLCATHLCLVGPCIAFASFAWFFKERYKKSFKVKEITSRDKKIEALSEALKKAKASHEADLEQALKEQSQEDADEVNRLVESVRHYKKELETSSKEFDSRQLMIERLTENIEFRKFLQSVHMSHVVARTKLLRDKGMEFVDALNPPKEMLSCVQVLYQWFFIQLNQVETGHSLRCGLYRHHHESSKVDLLLSWDGQEDSNPSCIRDELAEDDERLFLQSKRQFLPKEMASNKVSEPVVAEQPVTSQAIGPPPRVYLNSSRSCLALPVLDRLDESTYILVFDTDFEGFFSMEAHKKGHKFESMLEYLAPKLHFEESLDLRLDELGESNLVYPRNEILASNGESKYYFRHATIQLSRFVFESLNKTSGIADDFLESDKLSDEEPA